MKSLAYAVVIFTFGLLVYACDPEKSEDDSSQATADQPSTVATDPVPVPGTLKLDDIPSPDIKCAGQPCIQ